MELLNSLYKIVSEEDGTFELALNADHFIYKAHFPGKPITPGVCIVQISIELLGKKLGRKVQLKTAKNIKFSSVISPLANPHITFKINKITAEENNMYAVQIEVFDKEKQFAKLSLEVA